MARKSARSGSKLPTLVHSGEINPAAAAEAAEMRERALLRAATTEPGDVLSPGLDAAEAEVIAEFSEGVSRLRERLRQDVSASTTKMLQLVAKLDVARGDEAGVRAKLEIASARAEHRDDLIAAEREVMAAERDLRLFRLRNQLTREPAIPRDQLVSGAWLAVILVLEATFNTPFFLIEGQSLVGAAFEGLVVSAANVGLGLMAGMAGLRLAGHRQLFPWKLGGLGVFAGSVMGAVSLGLSMALRRLAPHQPDTAGQAANTTANDLGVTNDFAVASDFGMTGDLSPLVLTVAFTAFSAMGFVFAAYKGWQGFFEPFPGYGQVAKRLSNARRRIEDLRHDFHATARQAIQDVQADLDEEIDADRDTIAKTRLHMAQVEEAEISARQSMEDLRNKAEMLITVYRQTAAEADGMDPSAVDMSKLLKADQPTATRARAALDQAQAQLDANEKAYAQGLSELRQVLMNLERDLAMSEAEAHSAALRQRAAELEHEDVDKTGKPKERKAVRRAPGRGKSPTNPAPSPAAGAPTTITTAKHSAEKSPAAKAPAGSKSAQPSETDLHAKPLPGSPPSDGADTPNTGGRKRP